MASSSTSHYAYREKKLRLGYKIFLSYSGADQDFLWELYDELLGHCYDPFFDRESLPKAAMVSMRNIVQEAADSKLAVFCLSQAFFTRNKNPLMELAVCVKKGVTLLPLFYKISVDMIKKSIESWYNDEWSKWENIDRDEFRQALKILLDMGGIENTEGWRPREFRRRVVEEIQKILAPDIRPNVLGICGGDRLVKVVRYMFDNHLSPDESTQAPAVVLGLYGPSGTGKSTLCKMLAHSEYPAACYIQMDSCMDKKAQLKRMKKVLSSVTNLSTDFIKKLTDPDEAQEKLFEQEYVKKVFLIIDNVILGESLEEARIYLDGGCRRFKPGSKILVTAHTKDVLHGLAVDVGGKWHIDAMPDLEEEEAKQILLKRSGSIQVKMELVKRCLNLCRFDKGGWKGAHYHPLMLNALAESLANYCLYSKQEEMSKWVDSLESSFSPTDSEAKGRVLQHLLKSTSYDLLNDLQKQVFLDIAFYLPGSLEGKGEILEWLQMVHGKNIEEAVRILERRGLIDLSDLLYIGGRRNLLMHDLYHEMASLIVQEKGSECLVIQGRDGVDNQFPLKCLNITRILFKLYHFRADLVMQNFPSLRVLAIIFCRGVEKLDLRGAVCLRSLEYRCSDLRRNETSSEMIHLSNLRYLCLMNIPLYSNQVVFHFGHKIERISIGGCDHVSGLEALNYNCTSLRKLDLRNCEALKVIEGLGEVKSLETVSLIGLRFTAFPKELLKFPKLIQHLKIRYCSSIPVQDTIDILSTPDLSTLFYLTSISILMQRIFDDVSGDACDIFPNWNRDASLVVESKEALHTISNLVQDDSHHHHILLLKFVLHLCFGGRHMKLKELVSEAHVVKALSEAQQPFCLLLALANHFGANLEPRASTIATMVAKAFLEWSRFQSGTIFDATTYLEEEEWSHFRGSGAILAATDLCVADKLHREVLAIRYGALWL